MNRTTCLLAFLTLFLVAFAWHATGRTDPGRGGAAISAGDSNGDGLVDISDAVHTLSFLFSGGPPPASCQSEPGAASAVSFDPTGSSLTATDVQAALRQLDQKLQDLAQVDTGIVLRVAALEGEVDVELVEIPAGTFIMGSPPSEAQRGADETQHAVTFTRPIRMGAKEITQAQFSTVMGWNPSAFAGCPDCPVEVVSWYDAREFCRKLTARHRADGRIGEEQEYRLPTESEWEYACRAGTTTRFFFEEPQVCGLGSQDFCPAASPYVWWGGNNSGLNYGTKAVGTKLPNPWGLYDMIGNAWEWCLDTYGPYPVGEVTDPPAAEGGEKRVLRGGMWSQGLLFARSATRYAHEGWRRFEEGVAGFRVVLDEVR